MAVCTQSRTVYGCTNSSGTTCTKTAMVIMEPNGIQPSSCSSHVLLSSAEYTAVLDAQSNFGWNANAFDLAVYGSLLMFVTGLGIGWATSLIRRLRTP